MFVFSQPTGVRKHIRAAVRNLEKLRCFFFFHVSTVEKGAVDPRTCAKQGDLVGQCIFKMEELAGCVGRNQRKSNSEDLYYMPALLKTSVTPLPSSTKLLSQ